MLPDVNGDGLLPPGRHLADLAEIEQAFVKTAPYPAERDLLWASANLHMRKMRQHLGPCQVWIDGGFLTHKPWAAPHDIDLAYLAPASAIDTAYRRDSQALMALLTLQDVVFGKPFAGALPRLQPIGDDIDAFVIATEHTPTMTYFDGLWSAVMDEHHHPIDGASKGYVEVNLP